jgi:hypothetical protein
MGCSRSYWLGAMENIYKVAGTDSFTWSKIMNTYPDITKSVLSRLKCSGWICKDKRPIIVNGKPKISKTVLWRLHPEAVSLCRNGGSTKNKLTKPVKKCVCEPKNIKK